MVDVFLCLCCMFVLLFAVVVVGDGGVGLTQYFIQNDINKNE